MAYDFRYGSYVKFVQGTPTTWALIPDSEKHSDTLYFVVDESQNKGQLYLGKTLISGAVPSGGSLADVLQVAIDEASLTADSILVYDEESGNWVNKPFIDIISEKVTTMVGATELLDGAGGLVPTPTITDRNKVLSGSGVWVDIGAISGFDTLLGADSGKTIREIAGEIVESKIADLIGTAPEELDTLGEIVQWIQDNQTSAELISTIGELKTIVLGTPASEGAEAVPGLQSIVTTLGEDVESLKRQVETNTDNIEELQNIMKWQTIIQEENE